jgi:hypothetical protein
MSNQVCNTVMIPVEEYEALRRQVEELTEQDKCGDEMIEKLEQQNTVLQERLVAMTKERNALLAEKSRWIDRANNYLGQACENVSANSMLIAAQADNARLRDALLHISEYWCGNRNDLAAYDALDHILDAAVDALATQPDHAVSEEERK